MLRIAGSHGFFDRAEVVALVIDDMRARLNEQLERARAASAPAPPRPSSTMAGVPPPSAAVQAAAPESAAQLDPAQAPQESLSTITPVTTAPHFWTEPTPLTLAPVPGPRAPTAGRRWRIGVGVALEVLGLAVGGLGVASLALDGRCVDDVIPCDYRFDGRTAGTIEAAVGSAAILTGFGLLASLWYERRTPQPRRIALPVLLPRGGLSAALEF